MWNRIIFLSIVSAIGVISASLCAPALPFIADHFSTHFSFIQFTISLFLLGNAFGQLASGPLSDQIGQRSVMLGGLSLYVLASCGCAVSNQMSVLLAARFFQGMGSAVGPVLARAIAVGSFPPTRSAQVQSYAAMGIGIASMLAIFGSGQITLVSWRGNFWLAAGLGIILLFWTHFVLKKTDLPIRQRVSVKEMLGQIGHVMRHPEFIRNALVHSLTYGLMYGYIALFPFLLMEWFQEKNPVQVGVYSAYMIGCYMLGAFLTSRLVLRFSVKQLVLAGCVLQLASGGFLAASSSTPFYFASLFLFNFSIGIVLPLTSANALAPFRGQSVGAASSSLGLSYRMLGSLLSMLICQFPLMGGRNLGIAILSLSLVAWYVQSRTMMISEKTSA